MISGILVSLLILLYFCSPLAKFVFHPKDEPLLSYLRDDNIKIEPVWYLPIIPMVLVNGAEGIGTGWMTKIPNHNPREIIDNLLRMLKGDDPLPMVSIDGGKIR